MSAAEPLRLGTRGSRLALLQAEETAGALRTLRRGWAPEIRTISTEGDRRAEVPLAEMESRGIFIREIEAALQQGEVDIAVHSLKDLPSQLPDGLTLAGVLPREDPRDVLLNTAGSRFDVLPAGSRVGTGSLRRAAQIRAQRPDLEVLSIRGNVDTRLRKLDEGQVEALVMAAAGLRRAGYSARIAEHLPPERFVPSGGQGAIGLEVRSSDRRAYEAAAAVSHAGSFDAAAAERVFLATLGGGCHTPVGCLARFPEEDTCELLGFVSDPAGETPLYRRLSGSRAEAPALARRCADELLAAGGKTILEELDNA